MAPREFLKVDDEESSDYFRANEIDDLLKSLRDKLSSVKPADPLKFLYNLLGHQITLREDSNLKQDSQLIPPSFVPKKQGKTSTHHNKLDSEVDEINGEAALMKVNRQNSLSESLKRSERVSRPNKRPASPQKGLNNHDGYSLTRPTKVTKKKGCFVQQQGINPQNGGEEDNKISRSPSESGILRLSSGESITLDSFINNANQPTTMWAIDIGGSLTKLVVWEPKNLEANSMLHHGLSYLKSKYKYGESGQRDKHMEIFLENGTLHFIYFLTSHIEEVTQLFSELLEPGEVVAATGGGAYKYADFFLIKTQCALVKYDELRSLLFGLDFLLRNVEDECFYFKNPNLEEESERGYQNISQNTYPYLLCNIGSGVSIMKVMGPHRYERVSGSCIGGGTYIGLCRLLCGGNTPEQRMAFRGSDAFKMALGGVANNVDMTVGDIYGGAYESFNLRAETVASAFGKVATKTSLLKCINPSDLAQSLLKMIGMNIAQLAYLCATRYKITNILFCGNFLRQKDNKLSMSSISYSIHYWSKGTMKACFLKHEGYLGSMGAYVLNHLPLQFSEKFSENICEENDKS